jgi:hypothetical protein
MDNPFFKIRTEWESGRVLVQVLASLNNVLK